ncbi:GAF domain-containing protein [Phormidium sp. LEGE 05292]|uniref:ATP-binding protein n=1 Tax=[Phormidium] sp. LEGE 05292 TaxID=767427 RepID=UPI00187ED486|nr:ATP-binding protein [Phormidium sp. LEGE 05292]MBE9225942.1 GAF domain-containing protein [Phormidium sp. LEGE 05292]
MTTRQIITAEEASLTNCEMEPIQIPGSIQPHGILLVLQEPDLTILQASENTLEILGIKAENLISNNLSVLIDELQIKCLKECLSSEEIQSFNPVKFSIKFNQKTVSFDGIIHRINGLLILELESAVSIEYMPFFSFYHYIRTAATKIQESPNLQQLCQNIATEVRHLSGFDRVMVYKFSPEGHGEVIAEDKREDLNSYLGLNYPATDIPKQARKLYSLNWIRLIADINYQPVPITPLNNSVTGNPIDLSFSGLRSVSPLHIEYLQNMGVGASMSISLMKEQKLWGLVACHHYSPKYISYEARTACKFLGQVMSVELSSKADRENYDYQIKLKSLISRFIEYMSREKNVSDGLLKNYPNLLELVSAEGAAICLDQELRVIGKTPSLSELKSLTEWIGTHFKQDVFYTDSLPKLYPEAEKYKDVASGLIGISLSQTQNHYVLCFRPEVVQTVNWAGNPYEPAKITKIMEDGSLRLSPRKSFELWKEIVKFKSLPWKQCEIEAVHELRDAIIKIVLRQADELAKLIAALQESEAREREKAAQLEQALKELQRTQTQLVQSEKMSALGQMVAGIAHEINNPINFIYGNLSHADEYTQDLLDLLNLYQKYFPEPGKEITEKAEQVELDFLVEDLPKLLASMKLGSERIREIVLALRNFSRLDESEMKFVDIHEGIDSTLLILSNRLKSNPHRTGIDVIKAYGKLPKVECYAGQLNQVFMNILANAIDALEEGMENPSLVDWGKADSQYSSPTIEICTYLVDNNYVCIRIKDNGCGIAEEMQSRLFDPFFTTKMVGKGTGIGLAISYAVVVEKHQGKLTCNSVKGKGAELIIEIPITAS